MTQQPTFNVWHEPWIDVLDLAGNPHTLSVFDALAQAHTIHVLADASPLTVGGTHRLLTAILQFIYQPATVKDVSKILQSGAFNVEKLLEFERHYAQRFDLFNPNQPFLQTSDVSLEANKPAGKTRKSAVDLDPVAKLLPNVPTASNRTHYEHVFDEHHRWCPACCMAALVTYSAFSQNGGRGWRSSITGDPPLYIFPVGESLFQGLALSLMSTEYQPKTATAQRRTITPWTNDGVVLKEGKLIHVGYIESLTFPARRVRLFPDEGATTCTRCGNPTQLSVAQMFWESGFYRDNEAEQWKDPFVAFYLGSDKQLKALKINKGKALWREYTTLFLSEREQTPSAIEQIRQLNDYHDLPNEHTIRFRCIGMKTDGKAKVFEWTDESLEVPPALLSNPDRRNLVYEALERANRCERIIAMVFAQHIKQSQVGARGKETLLKGIQQRMQDAFWTQLTQPFRNFVAYDVSKEDIEQHRQSWETTVIETGRRVLEAALNQRGDSGDLLQTRAEALSHYNRIVAKYRKEGWHVK